MAVGLGTCCIAIDFSHVVWYLKVGRAKDESSSRSAFTKSEILAPLLFICCCIPPLSFAVVSCPWTR